jgi:predicted Rossmann-fold nucleotide-binding protein
MAGSSSHHIINICVFGGSSPGKEKEFLESANHLGQVLAERKIHLVYGGGSLGLMGGVSIAVFLGGSQAVEHEFLTSSARQIIISAATAEQLIDQLQSFIPVIDPSMSRINWSTKESRKKLRLNLSLRL